jgi:hypothetical protein
MPAILERKKIIFQKFNEILNLILIDSQEVTSKFKNFVV